MTFLFALGLFLSFHLSITPSPSIASLSRTSTIGVFHLSRIAAARQMQASEVYMNRPYNNSPISFDKEIWDLAASYVRMYVRTFNVANTASKSCVLTSPRSGTVPRNTTNTQYRYKYFERMYHSTIIRTLPLPASINLPGAHTYIIV